MNSIKWRRRLNLAEYEGYLKKKLTPQRFGHSLGVMETMEELAPIYNSNIHQAMLAGLLHDAAKELTDSEWLSLAKDNEQLLLASKEYDYHHYLHGPVGAILVKRDLHIIDQEVLESISVHGYYGHGEAFNSTLSWCLRFADILEPGRDWGNNRWIKDLVSPLRKAAYGGHLVEGAVMISRCLVKWYEEERITVHPSIRQVANSISTEEFV
jgi:predicted HD superfamily hydrolase involved in NAD metabolism